MSKRIVFLQSIVSLLCISCALIYTDDNCTMGEQNDYVASATIGGDVTYYDSLKKAFDAVSDSQLKVGDIQLLQDVDNVNVTIDAKDNVTYTLDLNGHTYSRTKGQHAINNSGTLTIKNTASNEGQIIVNVTGDDKGNAIQNSGNLTVEANTKLIGRNGIDSGNGTVTINGGTIGSSIKNGLYAEKTDVTINGGTFYSNASNTVGRAFVLDGGKATITAGTFYTTGSSGSGDQFVEAIQVFNNGICTLDPDSNQDISVTSDTDYGVCVHEGQVTIKGGTFKCSAERPDIYSLYGIQELSGGTYKSRPYDAYIAEGYTIVQDGDGFTVIKQSDVETVTVQTFNELKTRMNDPALNPIKAELGQNITIPAGEEISVPLGFSITIPSGYRLTVEGIIDLHGTLDIYGELDATDGFIIRPYNVVCDTDGTIIDLPTPNDYNEYEISTKMQLQWVEYITDVMLVRGQTFILANDIDLQGIEFSPIGTTYFSGNTFDGNFHTVKNLKISPSEQMYTGMFSRINNCTIKNLTISDASVLSINSYTGILAGLIYESATIINVDIIQSDTSVPSITGSVSYGLGGYAGQVYKDNQVIFAGCDMTNVNINGYSNVGGFYGTSTSSSQNIGIYNCNFDGCTISARGVNYGYIGGYVDHAKLNIFHLFFDGTGGYDKTNLYGYIYSTDQISGDWNAAFATYVMVGEKGEWSGGSEGTPIFSVQGAYYTTLEGAIDAKELLYEDSIVLLEDYTVDQELEIDSFTKLYLDDKTLTITKIITNDGTILINNGKIIIEAGGDVKSNYCCMEVDGEPLYYDYYTYSQEFDLPIPKKTGYDFKGWYTNVDFTGDPVTSIEKNSLNYKEFFVKWEVSKYSVEFNMQGHGTQVPTQMVEHGQKATVPTPAPSAPGYNFGGWYVDSACETPYDFDAEVTQDITLYAKWSTYEVTITFKSNDGTGTTSEQSIQSSTPTALKANEFTREGYAFKSWNTKEDGTGTSYADGQTVTLTENLELYAIWDEYTLTVTFNANGGDGTMPQQTIKWSDAAKTLTPNTFTNEGYNFGGWKVTGGTATYADQADVSALLTKAGGTLSLDAQWSTYEVTVTFDSNGGTGTMEAQKFQSMTPTALNENKFTREGYNYVWWNTKADGTGITYANKEEVALTGNITLYAIWQQKPVEKFTVTFDTNGGSAVAPASVQSGMIVEKPENPSKDGTKFAGWFSDAALTTRYTFTEPVTKDITLYAKWIGVVNVSVPSGDGYTSTPTGVTSVTIGVEFEFTITAKEGYTVTSITANGIPVGTASGTFKISPKADTSIAVVFTKDGKTTETSESTVDNDDGTVTTNDTKAETDASGNASISETSTTKDGETVKSTVTTTAEVTSTTVEVKIDGSTDDVTLSASIAEAIDSAGSVEKKSVSVTTPKKNVIIEKEAWDILGEANVTVTVNNGADFQASITVSKDSFEDQSSLALTVLESSKDIPSDIGKTTKAFELDAKMGGNTVSRFSDEVKVVMVFDSIPATATKVYAYCIDNGDRVDATFNAQTGEVTFETIHFSSWTIVYEEPSPSGGNGVSPLVLITATIVLALVLIVTAVVFRSNRSEN